MCRSKEHVCSFDVRAAISNAFWRLKIRKRISRILIASYSVSFRAWRWTCCAAFAHGNTSRCVYVKAGAWWDRKIVSLWDSFCCLLGFLLVFWWGPLFKYVPMSASSVSPCLSSLQLSVLVGINCKPRTVLGSPSSNLFFSICTQHYKSSLTAGIPMLKENVLSNQKEKYFNGSNNNTKITFIFRTQYYRFASLLEQRFFRFLGFDRLCLYS